MKLAGHMVHLFVSSALGGSILAKLTGEKDSGGALIAEAVRDKLSAAAHDVLTERRRHLTDEGWTHESDDQWVSDELAALACLYAMPTAAREWDASSTGYGETLGEAMLPPGWRFKAGNRRDELKKAGALIQAEIERIDRASKRGGA